MIISFLIILFKKFTKSLMLKLNLTLTFIISIFFQVGQAQTRFTISGTVKEEGSSETMPNVNIYQQGKFAGAVTNSYGFYSITLPADSIELVFSFVGYQTRVYKLHLDKSIELNVELTSSLKIEGITINATISKSSSRSPQMSVLEIPIAQIKSIPAFLGEKDVLKVIQLLPGVQKGSEGNSGLYVRGGGPDQNLIILDDAPVYNVYHLFGFMSIFNGDAIKSIELTKGGFPARYGGRISSVLDVAMKDGNKEKISGEAGIGLLSSRFLLEGPIKKDKASFIISARRTYIDMLLKPFMPANSQGGYFFYDLTAKANWEINKKNKIFISSYLGRDKLFGNYSSYQSNSKNGLFWDNTTATIRWNRLISNKIFSNASFIVSDYLLKIYLMEEYAGDKFELSYRSGIRDVGLKYDLSWIPNPKHTIRFGISSVHHRFTPSAVVIRDDNQNQFSREVKTINTIESGLYVEEEMKIADRAIFNAGFRLSHFHHGNKNEIHLEPRITGSYFLNKVMSVKASFAQMNQYIHLLSNTGVGLPTDLWVPATSKVPSQKSWQAAFGLVTDIPSFASTLTLEGYYKKSRNIIAYREGASFLLVDNPDGANEITWENNITSGMGSSYGIELMAQRKAGKLSGWIGYTLSWTKLQFAELNFGKPFFAKYDRRHDLSIVGIYTISKRITLSATWVYGTGNAITLPQSTYPGLEHFDSGFDLYQQRTIEDYGSKNSFRMAPYHRLDVGIQFHKKKLRYERIWEVSVYNVYNRHNPYFYFIDNNNAQQQNVLKQVSLFPVLPSFSWSIKF